MSSLFEPLQFLPVSITPILYSISPLSDRIFIIYTMIRLLSAEEQRGKKKSPPPSFPAAGAPLSRAGGLFRSLGISTIILEAEPTDERAGGRTRPKKGGTDVRVTTPPFSVGRGVKTQEPNCLARLTSSPPFTSASKTPANFFVAPSSYRRHKSRHNICF